MPAADAVPPLPWTGACQCGQLSYRITAMPWTLYCCHCTECQGQSASAFGMSLRCAAADVAWQGEAATVTRDPGRLTAVEGLFCPHCGTRIMHRGRTHDTGTGTSTEGGDVSIKAGTLADTSWLRPVGHIWLRSRQAWFAPPPGALAYEGQPPGWDALREAWARSLARAGMERG